MKPHYHDSDEDYLEAVLIVLSKKGYCRSVDLAGQLSVTKPSVTVAVTKLEKAGLLHKDEERFLHLTDAGLEVAQNIYERHCFFRDSLIRIGVDPEIAEKEACMLEHDLSQDSFLKIKERMACRQA